MGKRIAMLGMRAATFGVAVALGGFAVPLFGAQGAHAESLGNAVRRAVRTNPSARAAQAGAAARAGELRGTRSLYLPKVDAFGEAGFVNDSANGSSRHMDFTAKVGIEASYTLYDGYRRANEVYRNAARLDESLYNALSAASTTALNAVEAYVDVKRHRDLAAIANTNIARHREIRRLIVAQVDGGAAPVSDRFQIDERLLAARSVRQEIRKALADAETKYERVIGRRPGKGLKVPRVRHLPRSLAALEAAVRKRNYAIARAAKAISAAEYALEGEKGANRPNVSLYGRVSEGNDAGGVKGRNREAFAGLKLSWTLYDGGLSSARQDTLHAEASEALLRRDATIREVVEVAGRSWNAYVLGGKRHAILVRQERAASKIVRNYREEYSLSKRSLLDVLDAERARFNTGFQRISAHAAARFAQYRMLAVQSRLISHFGAKSSVAVPTYRPAYEERVVGRPREVFNVTIEPLR